VELRWIICNYEFIRTPTKPLRHFFLIAHCGPRTLLILDESTRVRVLGLGADRRMHLKAPMVDETRRKAELLGVPPLGRTRPRDEWTRRWPRGAAGPVSQGQANLLAPSILECRYVDAFQGALRGRSPCPERGKADGALRQGGADASAGWSDAGVEDLQRRPRLTMLAARRPRNSASTSPAPRGARKVRDEREWSTKSRCTGAKWSSGSRRARGGHKLG